MVTENVTLTTVIIEPATAESSARAPSEPPPKNQSGRASRSQVFRSRFVSPIARPMQASVITEGRNQYVQRKYAQMAVGVKRAFMVRAPGRTTGHVLVHAVISRRGYTGRIRAGMFGPGERAADLKRQQRRPVTPRSHGHEVAQGAVGPRLLAGQVHARHLLDAETQPLGSEQLLVALHGLLHCRRPSAGARYPR